MQTGQGRSSADMIAVIGIAGRYPGSRSIGHFWENLTAGKETISFYSDEELVNAGVNPEVVHNPSYVKARPTYERPMEFDAPFFGYTPREADVIDPQQRIFLECAWEALEDAGYDPLQFPGRIALYGGAGMTNYLFHLLEDPTVLSTRGGLSVFTSNEKDYLATRVGYKLNLRGPCVTLQTACSTSLVGIVFACQSLLDRRADMAMAGGVTILPSEKGGYHYNEGGIVSPDGHNRAFDASGKGTVFGSGAGLVVLRRIEDAIASGDNIYAVIRGFGMNNDGSSRVGFTAPGVDGQVAACLEALEMSSVSPEEISYIECHGTATKLGDLVEMTALTKAYRTYTQKKQFCAVGSVKTNIGHMDSAAGVAGFTKAVLALKNRVIPANLHFERPNPEIDFANSPFYVNAKLSTLEAVSGKPLRAAVSSFGVGGTNAHVIIEEAPVLPETSGSRPWQLLAWSARTPTALGKQGANLADYLERNPEVPLADVAYTLQTGRRVFDQRSVVVCGSREEAIAALRGEAPGRVLSLPRDHNTKSIAFLFPGQGSQHVNMARETYQNEPVFRSHVDRCAELLEPLLGLDLRTLLYPEEDKIELAEQELAKTQFAQPALFVIEYAMARLWGAWGIHPQAMVGHSIGEYVAACLAGVFSLEDALQLVATRGRLMQSMSAGCMLGVLHPQDELLTLLESTDGLSLAASNGPSASVVAGPAREIAAFEAKLESQGIPCRPLHTSHAFHSAMMDPMLDDFRKALGKVNLNAPQERYLSNLTGVWIAPEDATSPEYWIMHLRNTVRFSENVANLLADPQVLLLEVGPGRTLSSLVTQHPARQNDQPVFSSLPHPKNDATSDLQFVMTTAGKLWLEGKPLRWQAFYEEERRRRVSLPTYPFDHESYEVEIEARVPQQASLSKEKILDISKWFHYQSWRRSQLWPAPPIPAADGCCLIFMDACGVGKQVAERMRTAGWEVLTVEEGTAFALDGSSSFVIRPGEQQDYLALVDELARQQRTATAVFHLWGVTPKSVPDFSELAVHDQFLARGFTSVFYLAPAMSQQFGSKMIRLAVVTSDIYNVSDDTIAAATKAAVTGPCRAMRSECPNIVCRTIDIGTPAAGQQTEDIAEKLVAELFAEPTDDAIAYRGTNRWLQAFEPLIVESPAQTPKLKRGGTYLITGGMGGIGIVLAEAIATIVPANLALFSRSPFPPRDEWDELQQGSDLTADKIRRLLRMEELGSRTMVLSADVSDFDQMSAMKAQVEAELGPVCGVIHSAGVAGAGIMLLKSKAQFMDVLLPKIKGTLVLEELFRQTSLDFFILCSSLNSFCGQGGISDYIAANAFLDAFANSRRKSLSPPLSVQWDSWEDVGMIASYYASQRQPEFEALQHALFTSHSKTNKTHTFVVHLDPEKHWVVGDHVLMGVPTLVGTTHLQFALSAFGLANGEGPVEMRDVLFLVPLTMKQESTREVHVVLEQTADQFWEFTVKSRKANAHWQTHAVGKIGRNRDVSLPTHDLSAILDRCSPLESPNELTGLETGEVPFLRFGKRWKNIEAWNFGQNEALGRLQLAPEFASDLDDYQLHPAIMDTATSFAIVQARTTDAAQYLPFAYNRVRINDRLPDRLYSHARFEKGDSFISSNLTLIDEQGRQLVQIDGYEVHKISQEMVKSGNPDLIGAEAEADRLTAPKSHIPKNAKPGARIHSSDGIEVFRRLLHLKDLPQIAVACRPLKEVHAELKEVFGARSQFGKAEEQKTQKMHQRPTLASDFVAPRNDLELALAEIWQSNLGIQGIGVHDDFVELGGNSLLSIQVASRIRTEFEIELSIAAFYKNPTIARLAESILETLHQGLSEAELASALDEIEAQGALGTELRP